MKTKNQLVMLPCSFQEMAKLSLFYCLRDQSAQIHPHKLEAFIGLQYLRGLYGERYPVEFLWNKEYRPKMFCKTMVRDCFVEIKRFLRFDNKDRRRQQLENDKFVHIRKLFEAFTSNCLYNYTPEWSLTIDEQLFPIKNRCSFIVFMPQKPDKFGIYFGFLRKSVLNMFAIFYLTLGLWKRNSATENRLLKM